MHARNDPRDTTAAARVASRSKLNQRLLQQIDPDGTLPADDRQRRLAHARSAHFAGLAFKRIAKTQPAKRTKAVRGA